MPPTGKDKRSCQRIKPNPQLALVVELLAYGGLRVGEALALRRKHVDVLGCRLVVAECLTEINDVFTFGPTKTHQVREVPLPSGFLPDLEEHLDHDVARTVDALVSPALRAGRFDIGAFGAALTRRVAGLGWSESRRTACGPRARRGWQRAMACRRRRGGWGTAAPASRRGITPARWPAATRSWPIGSTRLAWPPGRLQAWMLRLPDLAGIWHEGLTGTDGGGTPIEAHPL